METVFLPASLDVALTELRVRFEAGVIISADYRPILKAIVPGGSLLTTLPGRKITARTRMAGLDALARVAHELHEASHLALFGAIHQLMDGERS